MFMKISTHRRLMLCISRKRDKLTEELAEMECSRNAYKASYAYTCAENMKFTARINALTKAHAPIKDIRGNWRDPKTGAFVKSPAKAETEAQLRKEAEYMDKLQRHVSGQENSSRRNRVDGFELRKEIEFKTKMIKGTDK